MKKVIALLDLPVINSVPPDAQKEYWRLHSMYRSKVFYKNIDLPEDSFEELSRINVGLGLVHSALVSNGYECSFYNSSDDLIRDIKDMSIIGISSYTCNYHDAISFSKKAKEINPDLVIVIGGAHVTAVKEEILNEDVFDFAIHDIGHGSFVDLVNCIVNQKGGYSKIKNLIFRDGDKCLVNELGINQGSYCVDKNIYGSDRYSIARIFFQKGCMFNCAFCTNPKKYNFKFDEDIVFRDMTDYKENYGTKIFYIGDEIFVKKGNEMIISRVGEQNVYWAANSHIGVFSQELAMLLKDKNCIELDFGVESCDEKIRSVINKTIGDNKRLYRTVELLAKHEINALFYFIIGLPGQTPEIIEKEFEFMGNLLKMGILPQVDIFSPYPGSDIYLHPEKYKIDIHGGYPDMVRFGSVPYSYEYINNKQILDLYIAGLKQYIIPEYEKLLF